jgi:hypothetical protein
MSDFSRAERGFVEGSGASEDLGDAGVVDL